MTAHVTSSAKQKFQQTQSNSMALVFQQNHSVTHNNPNFMQIQGMLGFLIQQGIATC
jgi:hypothetical protein